MSGSNYFISVKQIVESEKKIKLVSSLKHSGMSLSDLSLDTDDKDAQHSSQSWPLDFDSVEPALEESELQIITYERTVCSRIRCFSINEACEIFRPAH